MIGQVSSKFEGGDIKQTNRQTQTKTDNTQHKQKQTKDNKNTVQDTKYCDKTDKGSRIHLKVGLHQPGYNGILPRNTYRQE